MASTGKKKKKKPGRKWTVEEYAAAIRKAQGFTSVAAELLGVTVRAVNKRVQTSKMLQDVMKECREFVLDVAESKLFKAIQDGKMMAVMYYLNNQGKARGYGRKWWDDGMTVGDGKVEVKWIEGKPARGEEEDEEADIDLEALGVAGKLTPEDLGLKGKGAGGNGSRVNGKN